MTCPRCGGDGFHSIYGDYCTACANEIRFGEYYPFLNREKIDEWEEKERNRLDFIRMRSQLDRVLRNLFG
jgi:hypothetical protein